MRFPALTVSALVLFKVTEVILPFPQQRFVPQILIPLAPPPTLLRSKVDSSFASILFEGNQPSCIQIAVSLPHLTRTLNDASPFFPLNFLSSTHPRCTPRLSTQVFFCPPPHSFPPSAPKYWQPDSSLLSQRGSVSRPVPDVVFPCWPF